MRRAASRLAWTVTSPLDRPAGDALRALWRRAGYRNPFCGPAFLRVMAESCSGRGWTPLVALGRTGEGDPAAAWPLAMDRTGRLRFLQHEYSDQCTVLAAEETAPGELADGLAEVIREQAPRALTLTGVPPWGPTLDAARLALERSGWRAKSFPAVPCPVLHTDSGAALVAAFERRRSPRRYWNRFRRDRGAALELLTDPGGLDGWCEEFCDAHEWRWNATATPSQYRDPGARTLLRDTVGAWQEDGVLLCFSLRIREGRAAYAVVLDGGMRLLYHHLALSPLASHAGTVLMWLVGRWAGERGYTTLDFGMGGEAYKYRYANVDERLWRVFAAPTRISLSYGRAVIEHRIRTTRLLRTVWERVVNPYVRSPLRVTAFKLRELGRRARRR